MKNIIRLSMSLVVGLVLAGVWPRTAAAVTDEEFKTLQEQMQKQGQQIQDLQKGREEDQKEIQRLKQQVGETQATTAETQKKVEETQKTATEAAAVTAFYVFIIEVFVYRDISLTKDIPRVMKDSMLLVGAILMILCTAMGLTNYLVDLCSFSIMKL